jgi:alpha-galactosidase
MIIHKLNSFLLSTKNTSYLINVNEVGKVVLEYYGEKISEASIASLHRVVSAPIGCSVLYDEKKSQLISLDYLKSEYSSPLKGDYHCPSVQISGDKSSCFDFIYQSFLIHKPVDIGYLPTPRGAKEELVIVTSDPLMKCDLILHYLVYEENDVIGRYVEIVNHDKTPISLHKVASYELTLVNHNDHVISTYGSWANEGNREETTLSHGRFLIESNNGSSSARHNPFFLVKEEGCTRFSGVSYGFNLVYSGSHEESLEIDNEGFLHIQAGLSSTCFKKVLNQDEKFVSPIGVITYSSKGVSGVSLSFQHFVKESVSPVEFAKKPRPLVYNNWEGTGWNFTKAKLVSLMKKASSLGLELFVLDDGWFGNRNDDSHGLGDWQCNLKKLPGGLAALAKEAKKHHMQFGIWMEPEMVNTDAKVYVEHPDWIIKDDVHEPCLGRHQYTLNLGLQDVQDFVFDSVSNVLSSADISYLKWDMNRPIADVPMPQDYSSFYYDYMVGLYSVLDRLVKKFPHVLLENCASGGNRFDLGMLSYFAQSWMSDDTDSYLRSLLQSTFALAYPLSVFSNHVAAKVSNQMLRFTSLDSKFDVASFGVLGYEMDLGDCTPIDTKTIKAQVEYYKLHRDLFQFGDFIELEDFYHSNMASWEVLGKDESVVASLEKLQIGNPIEGHLMAKGLNPTTLYHYQTRQENISFKHFGEQINSVTPIHINPSGNLLNAIDNHMSMKSEIDEGDVEGAALESGGVYLSQEWNGTGYNEKVRLLGDFGGRLYYIKKI